MPSHLYSRPNSRNWIVSDAACTYRSMPAKKRVRSSALVNALATNACCSRYRNVDTHVMSSTNAAMPSR